MHVVFRIAAFTLAMVFFASCSHKADQVQNHVSIDTGALARSMSTIPNNRVACFGASVDGASIPAAAPANACSPPTGLVVGYVKSGQDLPLTVPTTSSLNISIFMYLEPPGKNLPCPVLNSSFPLSQLGDTYLVGSASGVNVSSTTTTVDVSVSFPGVDQNIAKQLSMNTSCQTAAQPSLPPMPYAISSGQQTMSSSSLQIHARAGTAYQPRVLTGTGIQMIVR